MNMANTAVFTIVSCVVAVSVAQKLILTHAPSYIKVQQQSQPLSASHVPSVISDTLGLTDLEKSSWSGLMSESVFKRPKANVLLTVFTTKSPNHDVKPQHQAAFPVEADVPVVDVSPVMNMIQASFLDHQPVMLDLMADTNVFDINSPSQLFQKLPSSMRSLADQLLDPDSVLSQVHHGSLNRSFTPDLSLMAELQMVENVLNTLKKGEKLRWGKTPDLFSFVITGLKAVSEAHGSGSEQAKDAHHMVSQFIDKVTGDFRRLYKDNVVVEVLTVPAHDHGSVRKSRSLMQAPATTAAPGSQLDLNLAWNYYEDFPAMFNIVLWMTVLLSITVFVIAYGMWNIDPGRDSIIYRMTSQRLKKD